MLSDSWLFCEDTKQQQYVKWSLFQYVFNNPCSFTSSIFLIQKNKPISEPSSIFLFIYYPFVFGFWDSQTKKKIFHFWFNLTTLPPFCFCLVLLFQFQCLSSSYSRSVSYLGVWKRREADSEEVGGWFFLAALY